MEKTQHALLLQPGSLTLYNDWERGQLLVIAEDTIGFMNRILNSVEGQKTQANEKIIKQRFEFNSFYMKIYNADWKTEYFSLANGIDWVSFRNITEEDDALNPSIKRLTLNFNIGENTTVSSGEVFHEYFEMYIPKEKLDSVKKAILRLVDIAKEEKHGAITI